MPDCQIDTTEPLEVRKTIFYLRTGEIFSLSQIFPRMFCHVSFRSLYTRSTFSRGATKVDVLYWQLVSSAPPCHLGLYHPALPWPPPASVICHSVETVDTASLGPRWELSVGTTTTTTTTSTTPLHSRPVAGTLVWPRTVPTQLCKECLTESMSWLAGWLWLQVRRH